MQSAAGHRGSADDFYLSQLGWCEKPLSNEKSRALAFTDRFVCEAVCKPSFPPFSQALFELVEQPVLTSLPLYDPAPFA